LELLAERLSDNAITVISLRGGMGRKATNAALNLVVETSGHVFVAPATRDCPDTGRVILATGRFIGKGFDDPRLDTCFLRCPFRGAAPWRNTRDGYKGKREARVYDYADLNVRILANMFDRRCRGYVGPRA